MKKRIDLNCDLGEWKTIDSFNRDKAIMPFISSCNIACGGHIGDDESMLATIKLAKEYGVAIGAHPSYPDKENFGRKVIDIKEDELKHSLESQIFSFMVLLEKEGVKLHHIKPHGALYNHAAKNVKTANVLLSLIKSLAPNTSVYLPFNSVSAKLAKQMGLNVIYEVFADRAYEDDLSLRNRSLANSVLKDDDQIKAQLKSMVLHNSVTTYSGKQKSIKAETICIHSDTPGAVHFAKTNHDFLSEHGIEITAP